MTTATEQQSEVPSLGHGMGCMSVHRAKDGSFDHYYSLAYIPIWKFSAWLRYRRNFHAHLNNLPEGRIWVETPNHVLPFRRARRQYA